MAGDIQYIAVYKDGDTWMYQTNLSNGQLGKDFIYPTDALMGYAAIMDVDVKIRDISAKQDDALWVAGQPKQEEGGRYGCLILTLIVISFWTIVLWSIL